MDEKSIIEIIMSKGEAMRSAQRDYFMRKMPADKKLSMALEKDFDDFMKQLRRHGYDPVNVKPKPQQKKMF